MPAGWDPRPLAEHEQDEPAEHEGRAGGEHGAGARAGGIAASCADTWLDRDRCAHRPPMPASRAFTIACARSTTWILVKTLDTWLRTVLIAIFSCAAIW